MIRKSDDQMIRKLDDQVREERMKASLVREARTAPTFMLPLCAILTGRG